MSSDPNIFFRNIEETKQNSTNLKNIFLNDIASILDFNMDTLNNEINTKQSIISPNESIQTLLNNTKSNFEIINDNLNIIKDSINLEKDKLIEEMKNTKNNEHFAKTMNEDYSNIYKYRYLRNWGIFFSILISAFLIKKIK